MKRQVLFFIAIFFSFLMSPLKAQNITDALNVSQYYVGGTARGIALGGAFGALGADMTSLSINPAGIGVYRSSEFVFSPGFTFTNAQSDFYGNSYTDNANKLNLGNLGIVFSAHSNKDYGWIGASFGLTYNKLVDFNNNLTIEGRNTKSSFLDEFIWNKNSGYSDQFYEDLADSTGAIFFADGLWLNDFKDFGYGQNQLRTINTSGNVGEYAISFGANYSNILFLGATLGIQSVHFKERKMHEEKNIPGDQMREFSFFQDFSYSGTGFNFKAGAIVKPIDFLRLGAAIHTPTFYSFKSDFYTDMYTLFYDGQEYYEPSIDLSYDFKVNTPFKAIFSGALQHKFGLISFDYEYVDYSLMKMRGEDDPFTFENKDIKDEYHTSGNFKVGAEIKLEDFALRGGYGYYGSPYSKGKFNEDANTQTYSAGFGYRGKSAYFDIGYILFDTKYKNKLYYYDTGTVDAKNKPIIATEFSDIRSKMNRFVLTVGFKF